MCSIVEIWRRPHARSLLLIEALKCKTEVREKGVSPALMFSTSQQVKEHSSTN